MVGSIVYGRCRSSKTFRLYGKRRIIQKERFKRAKFKKLHEIKHDLLKLLHDSNTDLIIDYTGDFLDSSGIGSLIFIAREHKMKFNNNITIKFHNQSLHKIFIIAKLDVFFNIVNNDE